MPLPSLFRRKSSDDVSKPTSNPMPEARSPKLNTTTESTLPKDANVKATAIAEKVTKSKLESGTECLSDAKLTYDDIKLLFSGAPHFMLESGDYGRSHAQVLFPWNEELEIADLLDRRLIRHESFASITLHAHLPLPHSPGVPKEAMSPAHARKRPAFELGVFEVPNMLNSQGKEPGTIGMRYFLELPVRDSLRTAEQLKQQSIATRVAEITNMTSTEAFKSLKVGDQGMNIGKNAPWRDRQSFVQDRRTWKDIGVRDISMDVITARAAIISPWYNKMAQEGWRRTILDEVDVDTCYDELFTLMLQLPPQFGPRGDSSKDRGLGLQISALVNVLSTPGAWIDFSLPDSRLRFGEILWEVMSPTTNPVCDPGASRHWLLVQILLSVELAIRLDAALRDKKIHHSEGNVIPEIEVFHSLRNRKVDWDLVMARAFLDHIHVEDHAGAFPPTRPSLGNRPSSRLFSKWRQKLEDREPTITPSNWDFVLIPRDLGVQVEGLLKFAEAMHWPNKDDFERVIRGKMQRWISATTFEERKTFVGPLQSHQVASAAVNVGSSMQTPQTQSNENGDLRVKLEQASEDLSGGWLSRSWFTGLVLPGESASHFLISALLEHDPSALKQIGENADLHGGFVMNGRSWWSKSCIVGKVMVAQEGANECMGWIYTPGFCPQDQSGNSLANGWVTVVSHASPHEPKRFRINGGRKVAEDSNPLGTSRGAPTGRDFICARDGQAPDEKDLLRFEALSMRKTGVNDAVAASVRLRSRVGSSAEQLIVEWNLTYDVHFISAHACRVPAMRAIHPSNPEVEPSKCEQCEALHEHLLHKSFRYSVKKMRELLDWTPPDASKSAEGVDEVYVIDARGERSNEVLARAWCSKHGRHGIISRAGRTCISCSVREARALAVSVVIRISPRG